MSGRVWPLVRKITHNTWFDVAIICLVGLLPLTWFRGSLIAGMDLPFPLAPANQLMWESSSLWNPAVNLGAASPSFRLATYGMMNSTLHWFGFSAVGVEKIFFVFWFAGAGLSAYFLIRVLLPDRRLAAVMGALFYMLNPYTMFVRWYELNFWQFFYALIPLMLALFILVIRTGRLRYVAFFLLASLLMSPAFANLGSIAVLSLVLGGYLVTYVVQNRRARDKVWLALRYTLILAVLFIGISMWWVLPTASGLQQEASVRQTPESTLERVEFTSSESRLDRVLRLNGYCWLDLDYADDPGNPVIPYAESYNTPLIWILGWLIPALAIAGLWKVRRNPGLVWPAVLWVGGVFFMKGIQPPLGAVTRWMYETIPGMSIFRHPFDKFGLLAVLGLAPLLGAGVESLYNFASSVTKRKPWREIISATVLVIVAVLLLVVLVWPMWSGDVIYGGGSTMPSFRISAIPEEYQQASAWLDESGGEFRILPMPYNRDSWSLDLFDWYIGYDPLRWLLGVSIMAPSSYPGGEFSEVAAGAVLYGHDYAQRLCTLLNVKYVLLREDVNWRELKKKSLASATEYIYSSYPTTKWFLDHQDWLEPAARFGSLSFYLNLDWKPLQAYSASDHDVVDLEVENLAEAGDEPWREFGPVEWKEGDGEGLTVTATSDEDEPRAGIRRPLELGEGPVVYSYQMRTEDTTQAHLKVEWHGEDGALLEDDYLQPAIDGDRDWTPYSGIFMKPQGAASADLVLLMQPQEGATMKVRDLVLREQPWLLAISREDQATAVESKILISAEDVERLGVEDNAGSPSAAPVLTVEQTSPWSAHVKVTAESPTFVVLNQAFDAGWRAYEGSPGWLRIFLGSGRSPAQHFLANGYANGWYIDQPGEYELTLYYWPQTLLYLGIIVSVLTWVFLLVWYLLRRKAVRGRIWR
jgi:hypothetical protein